MGDRHVFGHFVLDAARGALARDGTPVPLGHRGLCLLQALLAANGKVVTKAELMDAAWPGAMVEESNLSVQIAGLRKLLGPAPSGNAWIATVPRIGYRFVCNSSAGATGGVVVAERADKPVIAVLPLANRGGDTAEDYLADGIGEDIIVALSRFRWFQVLSRSASFAFRGGDASPRRVHLELGARYVVEGSVRKAGERVRITVQLVDALAGAELWAERYDLAVTDVFAVQDEIAERVVGAIEPELLASEATQAVTRHTGNVTAWHLVRRGTWNFHKVGRATHFAARDMFREACLIDPLLPEAHIWLARVSAGILAYGWSDDPAAARAEGLDAGLAAIRLDERDPYAHYALAIVSAYAGRLDQARRSAERAVELNPSFALGHLMLGMAQLYGGDAANAADALAHGLRLNRHDPQSFVWHNLLAWAHLFSGAPERGLGAALAGLTIRPDWRANLEVAACCHAALGEPGAARRWLKEMEAIPPSDGDALDPLRAANPDWERLRRDLLKTARE